MRAFFFLKRCGNTHVDVVVHDGDVIDSIGKVRQISHGLTVGTNVRSD